MSAMGTPPATGPVLHAVLLQMVDDASGRDVDEALAAVARLDALPGVRRLSVGADVSVEGLTDGFTHGLVVELDDASARDAYLHSPEHLAAVALLESVVARIVVVDLLTAGGL